MASSQVYRVFKVKFELTMQDPDMPSPRYHTIVSLETNDPEPGSGIKHHVTGDIVNGMHYESKPCDNPDEADDLHSGETIGYATALDYPQTWNRVLEAIPAPPKQPGFQHNN